MLPLPSECRQRKDPYLAPLGGKGGFASTFLGLPWGGGIDTFHLQLFVRIGILWSIGAEIIGS